MSCQQLKSFEATVVESKVKRQVRCALMDVWLLFKQIFKKILFTAQALLDAAIDFNTSCLKSAPYGTMIPLFVEMKLHTKKFFNGAWPVSGKHHAMYLMLKPAHCCFIAKEQNTALFAGKSVFPQVFSM